MAQKECFEDLAVEKYIIVETLDEGTCDICREMDGKIFLMSEWEMGVTAPIFHPNCRGTTAPYFEDMEGVGARFARDVETGERYRLPKETTYKQWKEMQDAKYGEGTVDKRRKTQYNNKVDREQYDRYKSVLKELSPSSFEEFQEIKHGNVEEWKTLKYQYRTLNRYEVDGEVSAQRILDLDKVAWYTKQTAFDYTGFTGKARKKVKDLPTQSNAASMLLDGDFYFSYAGAGTPGDLAYDSYKGEYPLVGLKNEQKFKVLNLGDGVPRQNDTEAKFLEFVADQKEVSQEFVVTILSEKHICKSCSYVVEQFKNMYPKATVNIISGKRNYNNSEDGLKTWSHRKKVKRIEKK